MKHFDVLIVGAGHGGSQAAIVLRQAGFQGSIGMVGEEPDPPYERPPLSKEYLVGEKSFDQIMIRPPGFWVDRDVTLLLGKRVIAVDPQAKMVRTDQNDQFGFTWLIWSAGGLPRRLTCDGHDAVGVHTVRKRADVDRMKAELNGVEHAVVIGGGYIGLEAAAVLAKSDKKVVVLEAQNRVLARVAAEPLSRFLETEHRARGVDVQLGARVNCILKANGRVSGIRLHDGHVLPAHIVIVGIGIAPAVEPLLTAGAIGGNGVKVDNQCRTSLEGVFAIGDCALQANDFANGADIRVESVQNANDQAQVVAKAIVGDTTNHRAIPMFWSDQYDLRLQTVGLSVGFDQVVQRGNPAERTFSIVYLRQGRMIALDSINAVRDYVQGRSAILAGIEPDIERLANPSIPIKDSLAVRP